MMYKTFAVAMLAIACAQVASAATPRETPKSCARFKSMFSKAELAPYFKDRNIELMIEPVSYSSQKDDQARCAIRVLDADKGNDDDGRYIFLAAITQLKQAQGVFDKNKQYFLDMLNGDATKLPKLTLAVASVADSYGRVSDADSMDVLTTRGDTVYFHMNDSAQVMPQASYQQMMKLFIDKLDTANFDSLRKRSNPALL